MLEFILTYIYRTKRVETDDTFMGCHVQNFKHLSLRIIEYSTETSRPLVMLHIYSLTDDL